MTVAVANTSNTNSVQYWRFRTNELAGAMSTVVVTVNSNSAVGNASIVGSLEVNTANFQTLSGGNNTSTANLAISSNAVFAAVVDLGYGANVIVRTGNSTVRVLAVNSAGGFSTYATKITFADHSDANVVSTPSNGSILTFIASQNAWTAGFAPVSGTDTQVQFNDGGVLNGTGGLTFAKTSNTLTVANTIAATTVTATTVTANVVANTASLTTSVAVGSGTSNVQVVPTSVLVQNSTTSYTITAGSVLIGNSTVNATMTASTVTIKTPNSTSSYVFGTGNNTSGFTVTANNSGSFNLKNNSGNTVGVDIVGGGDMQLSTTSGTFTLGSGGGVATGGSTNFGANTVSSNNYYEGGTLLTGKYVRLGTTGTITVGYTLTPASLGNMTNFTINPAVGNYQYGTNHGAVTITAPASDCAIALLVTNDATAGAITFSGFTVSSSTGDALTTTNTSKFLISINRINSVSTYVIKALQ